MSEHEVFTREALFEGLEIYVLADNFEDYHDALARNGLKEGEAKYIRDIPSADFSECANVELWDIRAETRLLNLLLGGVEARGGRVNLFNDM